MTCQAIPKIPPVSPEDKLVGQKVTKSFNLSIFGIDSFEVEDQTYMLDGSMSTFGVTSLLLIPSETSISFIYTATLVNGE